MAAASDSYIERQKIKHKKTPPFGGVFSSTAVLTCGHDV
jgi:hypothetical protein